MPGVVLSGDPANIDDLGLNSITDNQLFSSGFKFEGQSLFAYGSDNNLILESTLEGETIDTVPDNRIFPNASITDLDGLESSYQSQGLRIKRLSTSWQSDAGTLTVGSNWTNFQDVLGSENKFQEFRSASDNRTVANQVKWLTPNGFSIAVEDSPGNEFYSSNGSQPGDEKPGSSPSVILSWQGGPGGGAGEYRVSAMGKKLDANASGQNFNGGDLVGWGLNLEGGWQIGDLFAALSVTYGNGINSYILQRSGNNILVSPNSFDDTGDSIGIRPSLYYSLNNNHNFHVAFGRYTSEDASAYSGIDTLDTIHMGYSWKPWPSTKFGLEVVGQNAEGPNVIREESTQVKFGAQKLF
jgi:hypothetical protein